MVDVAISIVTGGGKEYIDTCLESIIAGTKKVSFEIYVVDNATEDGTVELIRRKYPQVFLSVNAQTYGFSRNQNHNLSRMNARYVVLLNDDCEIQPDCFDRMAAFMDSHPECGAAGPKILNTDGTLQLSCRSFPSPDIRMLLAGLFHNNFLKKLFPMNPFTRMYLLTDWDHSREREVDWVSGSCLMIRQEALKQVGFLDENYRMFVEDVDWCYRARKMGWKIFYAPQSAVVHHGARTTSRDPVPNILLHHKSMYRFYKKHFMVRGRLKAVVISGLVLRAVLAVTENRIKDLFWRVRSALKA